MQVLNFSEDEKGWWLAIQFGKLGEDGIMRGDKSRDRKVIVQAVHFPKIDEERQIKTFFVNNHLNTTHNIGEITVKGVVRTMPQEERERMTDSLMWERQRAAGKVVGLPGSSDKYRATINEEPTFIRMGLRTDLDKKYPKTYVKTKDGWIPQLLMEYYTAQARVKKEQEEKIRQAEIALLAEKKFNQEFREGIKNGNFMGVLKKWTVPLTGSIKQIVADSEKKEPHYEPIEIPAMNTSAADGCNFKSQAGLFQYELIRKTISGGRAKTLTMADYKW